MPTTHSTTTQDVFMHSPLTPAPNSLLPDKVAVRLSLCPVSPAAPPAGSGPGTACQAPRSTPACPRGGPAAPVSGPPGTCACPPLSPTLQRQTDRQTDSRGGEAAELNNHSSLKHGRRRTDVEDDVHPSRAEVPLSQGLSKQQQQQQPRATRWGRLPQHPSERSSSWMSGAQSLCWRAVYLDALLDCLVVLDDTAGVALEPQIVQQAAAAPHRRPRRQVHLATVGRRLTR